MIALSQSLGEIKKIGPKTTEKLARIGINTARDLLWHFPFRYEDFSNISKIADLEPGAPATIHGEIADIKGYRTWVKKMFVVEAVIADDTGKIKAVWFNQRFLMGSLKKGMVLSLAGRVIADPKKGILMQHPIYEFSSQFSDGESRHTGRLVPIYSETSKLTSKTFRFLIKPILDSLEKIDEFLPKELLEEYNFPEINSALKNIHFPDTIEEAINAKRRFSLEDLFLLQLANLRAKLKLSKQKAYPIKTDKKYLKELISNLPFNLTDSQEKSLGEILSDIGRKWPMNRLLQGDVGSGKTIVAALAALMAAKNEKQAVFMAPTEILASQHYSVFKKFFPEFSNGVALLTSSNAKIFYGDGLETDFKKQDLVKKIFSGEVKVIVGTHSLISNSRSGQSISFKNLALVIIDEQHRFGVKQRAKLTGRKEKEGKILPHFFSMSATPIPRTLSITVFGDLELSIIDEVPKNRKPVITKAISPSNRDKAYAFIRGQVKKGRQIFVICPRIEKQELVEEGKIVTGRDITRLEMKNVKEEYEKLSKKVFPDLEVEMLHGKIKPKEKNEIMNKFSKGEIDVLVSTSVVEVGVDIPNATIMMVEGAERFGLAQLYQFRGRVGRGEHQSFCFLFSDAPGKNTRERLDSLMKAKSGFELAERDLEIRGPGEFLGESQTGMPDLAMTAVRNPELLKFSRDFAEEFLRKDPDLKNYPLLKNRLDLFERNVHLE